jgi:hypothetical protein
MKARVLLALVLTVCVGVAMAIPATAADKRAKTKVTIIYNGDGFQGKVKSKRASCIRNRTVSVYKQHGSVQDPSSDDKVFTDTSDNEGNWDTGTSGQAHGKFYARAKKTSRCRAGASATIQA